MFSARRNFKLPIKKQAASSLSRKRTPLDKEYNEEVLRRQSIRTNISLKRTYVADSGGVG